MSLCPSNISIPSTAVCILGAGPAGLAASLFLSKWGIAHTLIDRSGFPREKVCGETFDGKVFHTLRRFDPSFVSSLIGEGVLQECRDYALVNHRARRLEIHFPAGQTARLQGRRVDFDDALLRRVRSMNMADIRQELQISALVPGEEGWLLVGKHGRPVLRAGLLIGAVGAGTSLFPKEKAGQDDTFFFARTYYSGLYTGRKGPEIEICFVKRPVPMCFYICPLPGGICNVEIGIDKRTYRKSGAKLETLLEQAIAENPFLSGRFAEAVRTEPVRGAVLQLNTIRRRLSGDRFLLAGSAALSVNPLTGMGVGNAMLMGRLAAEQVRRSMEKGDFSAACLRTYEAEVRKHLRQEVRFSRVVTAMHHFMAVFSPFLGLLSRFQFLNKVLSQPDLIRSFDNPRFYWRNLR